MTAKGIPRRSRNPQKEKTISILLQGKHSLHFWALALESYTCDNHRKGLLESLAVFKDFEGSQEVDPDFSKSKVSASAGIDSIDIGVPKRDDHLKSPDFFDVKAHPKMTFISKSIKGSPDQIKRKDFGLTWNNVVEAGPVVGETVTITLKILAAKPLDKK